MLAYLRQLWYRPAGLREVLQVALPLVVSTLAWTLLHFVDRVFLMWYSVDAVAAALPAAMLSFAVICFPLGVASYVTTFVAQYYGAGRPERIGAAVWQGVWLGVASVPLILLSTLFMPWVVAMSGHPPAIAEMEIAAYGILAWGGGAWVINGALAGFFTGRGNVRVTMLANCFAAGLNIVLDYLMIFGHLGLPEGGIRGAALATAISIWAQTALYLGLLLRPKMRAAYGTLAGMRFDKPMMLRLLRFGAPNGLHFFVDVGAYTGFLLIVGRLGSIEMTATSLAFNVNSLAFMPVLGIGWAVTTLVGQRLGSDEPDLAERATWSAFAISALYMAIICSMYVFWPESVLWPYRAQADAAEFQQIRSTTVILLWFVAAYSLFDAMNIIFASAIKGAGDMRFVMITQTVLSPLPIVLTAAGMYYWNYGLYWAWFSATIWLVVMGLAYTARFIQGKWRGMRVIEPDLLPTSEIPALATAAAAAGE